MALTVLPVAVQAGVPFWGERLSESTDAPLEQLKQGQWVWRPQVAPSGLLLVLVDLHRQMAHAYRDGLLIGYTTASTGKKGYETPTGVFHTHQKDRHHRSSIYNNAAMPFTQRLTWGGVALHAGGLRGYPSSHGCVHLPSGFAELLFDASPSGMTVVVAKGAEQALGGLPTSFSTPLDADTGEAEVLPRLAGEQAFRWTPEAPPDGPLSLVLSRADARLLVMRGGVEIGRARLGADWPAVGGTLAFAAHRVGDSVRWSGVAVPGHADVALPREMTVPLAAARLPAAFIAQLRHLLHEGASLVLTDAAMVPQTTGAPLTVVTNQPPEN